MSPFCDQASPVSPATGPLPRHAGEHSSWAFSIFDNGRR